MKVLLHVSHLVQWDIALSNSKNLKAIEAKSKIEIVVNAHAIQLYRELSENLLQQLNELENLNIKVKLCRNALRNNNIEESTLPATVEIVPAGIFEIIKKQEEGYYYVSP
ncbi:DsrE family protein [Anaerosphaera multitolerans]|uniref:Uncharacterized protein n=1 Tax=Anaerosphaera multitolerans TaxID=2487351 RepID=A0A437S7W1_9FIRM|nr:DsrE family protein [Anaerosphaera multitolerans]RVU55014.1 hypothetical protein EF514_03745 [Anaerosphaera multitolerans]